MLLKILSVPKPHVAHMTELLRGWVFGLLQVLHSGSVALSVLVLLHRLRGGGGAGVRT